MADSTRRDAVRVVVGQSFEVEYVEYEIGPLMEHCHVKTTGAFLFNVPGVPVAFQNN